MKWAEDEVVTGYLGTISSWLRAEKSIADVDNFVEGLKRYGSVEQLSFFLILEDKRSRERVRDKSSVCVDIMDAAENYLFRNVFDEAVFGHVDATTLSQRYVSVAADTMKRDLGYRPQLKTIAAALIPRGIAYAGAALESIDDRISNEAGSQNFEEASIFLRIKHDFIRDVYRFAVRDAEVSHLTLSNGY
jgi:hypothetical protein